MNLPVSEDVFFLASCPASKTPIARPAGSWKLSPWLRRRVLLSLLGPVLLLARISVIAQPPLPDAPQAQLAAHRKPITPGPCQAERSVVTAAQAAAVGAVFGAASAVDGVIPQSVLQPKPCPPLTPLINWYARFTNGPQVKPLTPKEKGWLAIRNVVDPFNAITILGSSAIAIGSDADSPYGPGMHGFGKSVGVSYAQDMTGEFFGTFLICSLAHQDPHYHREPTAAIRHRIGHALLQVLWTQGDDGKGMPNYANLFGYAIGDEVSNLYVPGRETDLPASAERYGTGLATAPIDNFITEFVPDLASHIHVRVVLIQRIINQVARSESANATP
jgi:hypothetical protein